MAKRKHSATAIAPASHEEVAMSNSKVHRTAVPLPPNVNGPPPNAPRRQSSRGVKATATNPDINPDVLDGVGALRASPDGHECSGTDSHHHKAHGSHDMGSRVSVTSETALEGPKSSPTITNGTSTDVPVLAVNGNSPAGAAADLPSRPASGKRKKAVAQPIKVEEGASNIASVDGVAENVTGPTSTAGKLGDPEAAEDLEDDEVELKEALSRPPPVNSEYLPLPWKGRLGYACLNTYLRSANPPVFSSRTCRIASILEHRHPLKDPSQPEHATKNRPDKDQPADVARGMRYVEEIGLANAQDIVKMVRWNDKYGIKFLRLSSEMFPFASHEEYGYKLAPFAADTLGKAGTVIAKLGHRVTTHPGQFTQLGSPRKQVIDNAIRDLEYHDEMLSLLKLPPQQNRDAVMILHLGGAYGDKEAAIARFKENYARLSQSIKNRLVLENDDVVWSVHELLPLCQELNIPFVLDFHHHNIIFDTNQIREGTKDIIDLFPAILETWTKKGITPKMHYSEPCPDAITRTKRRKHSPRVMTLPPCPDTMDLMIEAKDKEQAVFELMRTFKLPGFHTFSDMLPHQRQDENKPWKPKPKKTAKKGGKKKKADDLDDFDAKIEETEEEAPPPLVPEEEVGMGGPEGRVYWPPGMEDWLRPPKRIVQKKDEGAATPAKKKRKTAAPAGDDTPLASEPAAIEKVKTPAKKAIPKRAASYAKKKAAAKSVPTPSPSDEEDMLSSPLLSDVGTGDEAPPLQKRAARLAPTRKTSGRAKVKVSYKEVEADDMSL